MIERFKCRETEKIWQGDYSRKFPRDIQNTMRRKLRMLHAATRIIDLTSPPGNRLEKLSGDREGQYSIRVNNQWRVCFRWEEGNAHEVEIVDYH